jgi:transposase
MTVDIKNKACPCCGDELHRIGEEVSKKFDIVRAQFRVLVDYVIKNNRLASRARRCPALAHLVAISKR